MIKSAPQTFTLDNFALGLDWASPPDKLSPMSLYDAKNINLTSYKALERRSGMSKQYAVPYVSGQNILDIYEYIGPSATRVLVASNTASGAKVGYYSSGWNDLKTGLTKNARFYFETHNEFCFVTNGLDDNFKIRETSVYSVGIIPPAAKPSVTAGSLTGLTGSYTYKYVYKRSSAVGPEARSNPSAVSDTVTPSNSSVKVTVVESSDTQVDKIEIYRTLNGIDGVWYLVTTINNESGDFDDNVADTSLTIQLYETNTVPPKAYFCALHKDRMIYANCPAEANGESLFMFSEVGKPESCPSSNYQYFDRSDGNEITGIATLPDYLVVFKRNKMAALEGDFNQWYTISQTTGCIAPWAIIKFQDKILFLSDEGWKVTDGRSVVDVSKKLIALNQSHYISYTEKANYSAAYYPTRKQALFLLNHSSFTKIVMVGHLLSALYSDVAVEDSMDTPYIGWTYHQYDNHTLTALGRFTDDYGVEKILAGDSLGYVYLLDNGSQDDGNDIAWTIETGWSTLGTPLPMHKQARMLNVVYSSNAVGVGGSNVGTVSLIVDVDYVNAKDTQTLIYGSGTYCGYAYCNATYPGLSGAYTQNLPLADACVGRKFRFRLSDTSEYDFTLMSLSVMFRFAGLREGL